MLRVSEAEMVFLKCIVQKFSLPYLHGKLIPLLGPYPNCAANLIKICKLKGKQMGLET